MKGLTDLATAPHIALTIFYRSLQPHEAIEILLKQKLVEDARVLMRVLIEDQVNCAYVLLVADDQDSRRSALRCEFRT